MKSSETVTTIGRPRGFDAGEALERALRVFWEKGYEGASMADLTAAMGINRPSLYAAFGNKESLFRKVLELYGKGPAAYVLKALEEPTAREVAEKLLFGAAELLGNPDHPRGCLAIQSALACGDEAMPVKETLAALRCSLQEALQERFERAKAAGEFQAAFDAGRLARYILAVSQGMSVQASGGASGECLRGIAEQALKAWPD
jgi:AcrR family transcriptional regulator